MAVASFPQGLVGPVSVLSAQAAATAAATNTTAEIQLYAFTLPSAPKVGRVLDITIAFTIQNTAAGAVTITGAKLYIGSGSINLLAVTGLSIPANSNHNFVARLLAVVTAAGVSGQVRIFGTPLIDANTSAGTSAFVGTTVGNVFTLSGDLSGTPQIRLTVQPNAAAATTSVNGEALIVLDA